MATSGDKTPAQPSGQAPPQDVHPAIYQTPDWETSTRPQRLSLLDRLLPSSGQPFSSRWSQAPNQSHHEAVTKDEGGTAPAALPMHNQAAKPALTASLRSRLDKILSPHRTYFGRSRRFVLLYIAIPLLILLFIILPLAIGLGVGLSRRSSAQNLPLPSNTGIFTGDLTYYDPALGACGITSSSSESICAVSHLVFDAAGEGLTDPNANPLCGKKIRITRNYVEIGVGNRSVDVKVVDRCVGCSATDLDLTLSVFEQLAPEASGRVVGSWAWL